MTWRSAFVAALFAVHPLHVESVAWVAERKDVLSTFFFLLTLLAYARYVARSPRSDSAGSPTVFSTALAPGLCFALGLMSKPMLVTLPFVLLLLDYWPIQRISSSSFQFQVPGPQAGTGWQAPIRSRLKPHASCPGLAICCLRNCRSSY